MKHRTNKPDKSRSLRKLSINQSRSNSQLTCLWQLFEKSTPLYGNFPVFYSLSQIFL